jgi:hypothetical protein
MDGRLGGDVLALHQPLDRRAQILVHPGERMIVELDHILHRARLVDQAGLRPEGPRALAAARVHIPRNRRQRSDHTCGVSPSRLRLLDHLRQVAVEELSVPTAGNRLLERALEIRGRHLPFRGDDRAAHPLGVLL